MMRNRDQVIGAITTNARPLTMYQIFKTCDCFADEKDCAKLLNAMVAANEITSWRATGDSHSRYATPGMSYAPPAAAPSETLASDAGEQPNAAEMALARRVSPPAATTERIRVESVAGVDSGAACAAGAPALHEFAESGETDVSLAGIDATGLNMDAVSGGRARLADVAQQDARETDEVMDLLREHLSEAEFRGYCRGNLIALSLRGRPEDLNRLNVFGCALPRVAV